MRTSSSDDNKYPRFCELASREDTVFNTFKSSLTYNEILEHVTKEEGQQYYNHFKKNQVILNIIEKFKVNDSIGEPNTYDYNFGRFSPTTLRYVKVLSDLSQLKLDNKDIVEIGAGYGGQYTVLRQYAKPKSYTIIDLPEVIKLQRKYIKRNKLDDIELNFYSLHDLPVIRGDLLISNYAFSECMKEVQDDYIQKIINNCKRGYIIHNNFEGYSHSDLINLLPHNVKIFKEEPATSSNNVLLTWND
jgi:putative sugar O-methyltransferase